VSGVDGAVLRELRERAGLGLRRIASRSALSVSVGHLSRVERGERRVTPAILAAYEQALGTRIAHALADRAGGADRLDQLEREAFAATIGKVAAGGSAGEPVGRLLAAAGADLAPPARVGPTDVVHVEHATALVRRMDLQFGGELVWQMAEPLLRWAVGLHAGSMREATRVRLDAAIGALAGSAAWAAFDGGRQQAARTLFTVALAAAGRADDPDLRAHVMADVAAHYNYLGHPDDCLRILRLEGDERVGPAVQCVVHGVKAHVYAANGLSDACAREIELAQVTSAAMEPGEVPGWLGGFEPAHTRAVCGHAAAVLAGATGRDADRAAAHQRLTEAIGQLERAGRDRAVALCQTRLTMLHLAAGEHDQAGRWARQALATTAGVRSARVRRELATVREAAAARLDEHLTHQLATVLADQAEPIPTRAPTPPA
jgi:transcriptional regulator with XRE-family HTH domain